MLVTAFIHPKTSYRSVEKYLIEFKKLTDTGLPILLFTDTDFSFPSNVHVIRTALDTSWIPENVELPIHRNLEKDTLEYFCIQLRKLYFLKEATQYTTDPFLAWIDFGAFHMFRDIEKCSQLLKDISLSEFPCDKILAPGCWDSGAYGLDSVCWRFCGTFLLGHRDLFEGAYKRQTELVYSQFPKLSWEVNYWSQMDDLFHVYRADHNDLLLSRVMMFVHKHQGVKICSSVPSEIHLSIRERTAS